MVLQSTNCGKEIPSTKCLLWKIFLEVNCESVITQRVCIDSTLAQHNPLLKGQHWHIGPIEKFWKGECECKLDLIILLQIYVVKSENPLDIGQHFSPAGCNISTKSETNLRVAHKARIRKAKFSGFLGFKVFLPEIDSPLTTRGKFPIYVFPNSRSVHSSCRHHICETSYIFATEKTCLLLRGSWASHLEISSQKL